MSDTQLPPKVAAAAPKEKADLSRDTKGRLLPGDLPRKSPFPCPYEMELGEAEGEAIEALRDWTHAQTSPDLRARLMAWYELRTYTKFFAMGAESRADIIKQTPLKAEDVAVFDAVVAFWNRRTKYYRKGYNKQARKAKGERRAAKAVKQVGGGAEND